MLAQMKQIGETIICPHGDGDYELVVKDMKGWATGFCLLEQTGQGEEHAIMLSKHEAAQLAKILLEWSIY